MSTTKKKVNIKKLAVKTGLKPLLKPADRTAMEKEILILRDDLRDADETIDSLVASNRKLVEQMDVIDTRLQALTFGEKIRVLFGDLDLYELIAQGK